MLYSSGDSFMVEWPNRIYITLLSEQTGNKTGEFSFEYQYAQAKPFELYSCKWKSIFSDLFLEFEDRPAGKNVVVIVILSSVIGIVCVVGLLLLMFIGCKKGCLSYLKVIKLNEND